MRKKIITTILTMCICICTMLAIDFNSHAKTTGEPIDFSYLTTDDALIGYMSAQTRGVYLANGYSVINRLSSRQVGWGGITNAAIKCKVTVTSMVERKTSTGWAFVTSDTVTDANNFTAMLSRSLYVASGNEYRVRSYHYANSDSSTSFTNAISM